MDDSPQLRAVELFTLRGAAEAAARIGPEDRARLAPSVAGLTERRAAAEALWGDGFEAEALRLAVALEGEVRAVLEAHAAVLGAEGLARALGRGGAPSPAALDALRARAAAAPDAGLVSMDGAQLFWDLLGACGRVERALSPVVGTGADRARLLRIRRGLALGLPAFLLVAALVPLPALPSVTATASGRFSSAHRAALAIDGDPTTEWQLPDRTPGWLEVRMTPPRDVARLRILNGHNARFGDRGLRRARVTLYAESRELAAIDLEWDEIEDEPAWVDREVDLVGVDRIRIEASGFHGTGGALAEVAWE